MYFSSISRLTVLLLSSYCFAAGSAETSHLQSLAKSLSQSIHNVNTLNSDSNHKKIRAKFTNPGWRNLQLIMRKNGTNTLVHKHSLQQTIDINGPIEVEKLDNDTNVWQLSVAADVQFNGPDMLIKQRVVDVYTVKEIDGSYRVINFREDIVDEPERLDKVAKHASSCPLNT